MRTLLESFPDEGGQDNDVRADHGGGNSLADTVSGFIHEAAREMTGQHSEHDAHRHDHGGSHGHVHHHAHTHGEMGQGLVPAAESVVDLAESVGVRHIEEVLRDVPDVDGPEASPKSFIYVIVVTMILVLLLVLFIVWSFNLLDEKKKQKTDSQDAGGNFQPIRGRGFDTGNSSLHQRRPQYANNTVFANDNAPLGLPRPHVGAGAVAGAGYALGEVGSAMTLAAQQLQGVVADKTRYMGDTATKVATSLTQSMQQYSAGPLAGYVAGQVQQQMYGQQPKAQQQIQQGYGQATAQQQQFQQQPLPPQHPFYAGTTISSASAGKFPSQGSRNPVVIPPPPIHSNMGQWQGQGQGPAFQSQQQYQRASGGASASPVESSASFYGSQQGSGSRSGYSSDSSDRGSVSSTGRASGSSAVTSSRPAIVNTGDSPAGFGFGFGGLRGSGPLINVLRANAKAGRPDPVHQSQKLTEVAGAGRAGAPKTAPLSFVPLQADLVAKVAGKGAGAGGDVDVSGIMMSALPSLQIGDLAMEHVLGGGAFGQVWRGTWRGTPVAVKVLSGALQRETMPEVELKAFVDEVSMLARLRHPNICLFMGVCIEPPNRAIVTELVTRGSLWDVLRTPDIFNGSSSPFESNWPSWAVRKVLDGTCKGLLYLHSNTPSPIIHRDLKSANILLDDSFNVKICDFGLARLRDFSVQMTANVGTVQWMAPEVLLGKNYAESADIYSLGMIAWELVTAKCPFESMAQMEIAIQVTQNLLRPVIPAYCNDRQVQLLQQCWAADPERRLTAAQALRAIDDAFPNM